MAGFTGLTFTGTLRLGKDPEMKYTKDGDAWLTFSAVENVKDRDVELGSIWYDISVFGQEAENLAEILEKGKLIAVSGPVMAWMPPDKPDDNRPRLSIRPRIIAPSARFDILAYAEAGTPASQDEEVPF